MPESTGTKNGYICKHTDKETCMVRRVWCFGFFQMNSQLIFHLLIHSPLFHRFGTTFLLYTDVSFGVAVTFLGPVFLSPLFYRWYTMWMGLPQDTTVLPHTDDLTVLHFLLFAAVYKLLVNCSGSSNILSCHALCLILSTIPLLKPAKWGHLGGSVG